MIGQQIFKKCGCGQLHTEIPKDAKAWFFDDVNPNKITGYSWNCVCGSTLFQPKNKSSEKVRQAVAS